MQRKIENILNHINNTKQGGKSRKMGKRVKKSQELWMFNKVIWSSLQKQLLNSHTTVPSGMCYQTQMVGTHNAFLGLER